MKHEVNYSTTERSLGHAVLLLWSNSLFSSSHFMCAKLSNYVPPSFSKCSYHFNIPDLQNCHLKNSTKIEEEKKQYLFDCDTACGFAQFSKNSTISGFSAKAASCTGVRPCCKGKNIAFYKMTCFSTDSSSQIL